MENESSTCQGDLHVGLYAWAHNLLPILNSKSGNNPQSRDLILQLVESCRILSGPKARSILMGNAVRRGERLIPPSSFEILIKLTYPVSSARIKATERFEAVYPTLKEVALAGVPGSKAMKQVSQQIFSIAIKTCEIHGEFRSTAQTTVMRSNLNPVWNEDLMISVPHQFGSLKVEVFDHDTFSADDIMGVAEIDKYCRWKGETAHGT